jgi:hypothetical protein
MPQIIKRYFWIALLVAGLQSSWGFALLGPLTLPNGADSWQTPVIGYQEIFTYTDLAGDPVQLQDIGGPRNIAEEYRRNVPNLYYTFDQTYLNFFGTSGMTAVDNAAAIMNGVPSADTVNLANYPPNSLSVNFTAQSLYLTDLKSVTLHLFVEQLGLADPSRFVWTLHDRDQLGGTTCPAGMTYLVVQRNFSPLTSPLDQIQYSSYINSVLYSYVIEEDCTGPNPLAITGTFSTDPEAAIYTAVAANVYNAFGGLFLFDIGSQPVTTFSGGLPSGYFYTGLTLDDVAGLHYLFTTNNVNLELPDTGSLRFTVSTNLTLQQLLPNGNGTNGTGDGGFYFFDGNVGYGDYGWLVAESLTNSPAVLQALYPGLVIASSSNYFVLATNYTYTQYFTNLGIGTVFPPPLVLVTVTNKSYFLLEKYVTKFANVFPDHTSPNTTEIQQTTTVTPNVGAPFGSPPVTNTTTKVITLVGVPSGDFFLLTLFHTNACPLDILYTGLTNVIATTNFLSSTTTNVVTPTNSSSFSATLIQITYFTNYVFVTHPVACAEVPNAADLYQGIGGTKFLEADYDSLIGQFFSPITNYYTMVTLTNSQWRLARFVRVITQPDILLDAADQGGQGDGTLPFNNPVIRNITFTPSPVLNGLAGPGTIDTPSTFSYDKIGDSFLNGFDIQDIITTPFLSQLGNIPSLAWASYDASTNDPVLYPNGTSIQNLESILTINFSPSSPPNGQSGVHYSVQFAVTGGGFSPPYSWSASGFPVGIGVQGGLPSGMSVMTAPNGTGFILSGTPEGAGTYDFILQLTDSLGRSAQWTFTLIIN